MAGESKDRREGINRESNIVVMIFYQHMHPSNASPIDLNKSFLKLLDMVQNTSLCLALGKFRTSLAFYLFAEADLPPLSSR